MGVLLGKDGAAAEALASNEHSRVSLFWTSVFFVCWLSRYGWICTVYGLVPIQLLTFVAVIEKL